MLCFFLREEYDLNPNLVSSGSWFYIANLNFQGCRNSLRRFKLRSGKLANIQNRETRQIQIWSCDSARVGRASIRESRSGRLMWFCLYLLCLSQTNPGQIRSWKSWRKSLDFNCIFVQKNNVRISFLFLLVLLERIEYFLVSSVSEI